MRELHFILVFALLIFCSTLQGQCPSSTDSLDINQVNAFLFNGGDMFWDLNNAQYEVPKGSGIAAINAAALWFGAVDDLGQLKVAAQAYRQSGTDFHAGPLDLNTDDQEAICQLYDRFWKVKANDIVAFRTAFAAGNINSINDVVDSIKDWPGRNSSHGDFPVGDLDVAPFVDFNEDGNYDPLDGDYPDVRGDEAIWWIYNDRKQHTETGGEPLHIQVGVTAYAYQTEPLDYTTFYKYDFLNAGTHTLNDFRVGQWLDVNLGCSSNDFVGSVPNENLAFVYNGSHEGNYCGQYGYGDSWPILGMKFIDGLKDANGQELMMSSFISYGNVNVTGNPETAAHYYNFLKAEWKDGTRLTFGGNGYGGPPADSTNFMFPTNPSIIGSISDGVWSECSQGNSPFERRFVAAMGGITLEPGERNSMTVAIVWDDNNTEACPDINEFVYHVNEVENAHNQKINETALGIEIDFFQNSIKVFPNPMSTSATLQWNGEIENPNYVEIVDLSGKTILRKKITNQNQCIINRSSTKAGLYFYKLMNDTKLLATGKMIVE